MIIETTFSSTLIIGDTSKNQLKPRIIWIKANQNLHLFLSHISNLQMFQNKDQNAELSSDSMDTLQRS